MLIAVKLAGAAYLVYLGIRMWFDRSPAPGPPAQFTPASPWPIYRAALLTNVLNPKVALFFLAFLPQFVDPAADSKVSAFLFLGSLFILTGTIWCVFLALAASAIRDRLRPGTSTSAILRRATGAVFVGLGIRLAVSK